MGRPINTYTVLLSALAFVLALLAQQAAHAQGSIDVSGQDCASIVAAYEADPKAVPGEVAEACRQALNIAPGAGFPAEEPVQLAGDPCADPGSASSVFCWGPWSALAPAAGAVPDVQQAAVDPQRLEDNCAIQGTCVASTELVLPIEGCEPGLPCGFATVIEGVASVGDAETTRFARAAVAADGTSFTIAEAGEPVINSAPLVPSYLPRSDGFETLRAVGDDGGDQRSRLIARVLRQGDAIQFAADVWGDGNVATQAALSGMLAAGTAVSQADLDTLTNSGVGSTLQFSGPMSVDNATNANIALSYGANPLWTGSWENPAYSFTAGGGLQGANFVSDSAQFSANVQGGFVQGALLGPLGDQAVAHIVEVTLDNPGLIRDVGLLREVQP
ncbi:MAG: hypothetical protein V2J12_00205 [Gammaproteobacteria bacterium]|nr:hypothetical protein [Gammaproteobacteria bacterium]